MPLTCSDLFCTFAAGGALEIHGFGNTLNTLLLLLPPEGGGWGEEQMVQLVGHYI